jgi:hypothetical protein
MSPQLSRHRSVVVGNALGAGAARKPWKRVLRRRATPPELSLVFVEAKEELALRRGWAWRGILAGTDGGPPSGDSDCIHRKVCSNGNYRNFSIAVRLASSGPLQFCSLRVNESNNAALEYLLYWHCNGIANALL